MLFLHTTLHIYIKFIFLNNLNIYLFRHIKLSNYIETLNNIIHCSRHVKDFSYIIIQSVIFRIYGWFNFKCRSLLISFVLTLFDWVSSDRYLDSNLNPSPLYLYCWNAWLIHTIYNAFTCFSFKLLCHFYKEVAIFYI